jgi:nitrite reductase/ring-hydroxylating ferredoxin subunit
MRNLASADELIRADSLFIGFSLRLSPHIAVHRGYFIIRRVLYNGAPRLGNMSKRIELCSTEEVAPGAAIKVEVEDLALAVFNVDGEFYVTDDACTHGPGSLSEGYIEGDVVECNFHNGQFNIRTGEVVLPPCMVPVKTYPVEVQDGKVTIEVE